MDTSVVEHPESTQSLTSLLEEVCQQRDNHNNSSNSASDDGDSVDHIHTQDRDFICSEDGDNSSLCFETTIIEMEELIGNEEEFQEFIQLMAESEKSEAKNSPTTHPILDINCNEIKDKTVIPVIDIFSDDEEEADSMVSLGLSNTFDSLGSPVSNTIYKDSPRVASPIAPSLLQPTKSDLLSLGVKNVSASYLDYINPEPPSDLSTNSLVLETDRLCPLENYNKGTFDKPLLPESKFETLYKDSNQVNEKFSLKFKEDCIKDSLLDENCNTLGYCSEFTSIDSPSPKTEELLLAGSDSSETRIQTRDSVTETSPCNIIALAEPVSYEVTPDEVSDVIEALLMKSSALAEPEISVPLNGDVSEDIGTNTLSLSFYDKLDIEPYEVGESAEYDQPVPLPSPPPATIVEELVKESSTLLSPSDNESQGRRSVEINSSHSPEKPNSPCQAETVLPFLSDSTLKEIDSVSKPDVENLDCVSSNAGNSNSDPSSTSPPQDLQNWQIPWVSTDDAENADNNDPEWDLLRKLETDEERYRVVREQWRQLEIPDPRRDLTCHNYRRNRSAQSSRGTKTGNLQVRQARKRTRSADDNEESACKRRRMLSCTVMFESRINDLNSQINNQFIQLKAEHDQELHQLSIQQQLEHQKFIYSSAPAPGYIVQRQMNAILMEQDMQIQELNSKYDGILQKISKDKQDAIYVLKQASKEVLAFNKFYNHLGDSYDNHCDITEEELQQFQETEEMYELYDNIYTG